MKKVSVGLVIVVLCGAIALSFIPSRFQRAYTPTDQVYALSKMWAEAANIYGYWELLPEEFSWDDAYYQALSELSACESDYDYYCVLERFGAKLQDGHAKVIPYNPSNPPSNGVTARLPIALSYIEGQYILTQKISAVNAPLGSALMAVNGTPIQSYMDKEIAPLVGCQTPLARERFLANRIIMGPKGKEITLTFKAPTAREITVKLLHDGSTPNDRLPFTIASKGNAYESRIFSIDQLEGNIAHVRIKTFGDEGMIEEFSQKLIPILKTYDGVILDIRRNQGGNVDFGKYILEQFTDAPIPSKVMTATQFKSATDIGLANLIAHQKTIGIKTQNYLAELAKLPAYQRGQKMLNNRYYIYTNKSLNDDYANALNAHREAESQSFDISSVIPPSIGALQSVKCAVLIGPDSGSAVDSTASMAKSAGIKLVGTRTAGYTGNLYMVTLPNDWLFTFSAARSTGYDGEEIWNKGVEADIYVEQTLQDALAGVDTQLVAAINYIKTK